MIDVQDENGCLTLRINRPDKANALTEAMLTELADRIATSTATVLVLTGTGGVFSAGADLDDVRNGTLATSPEWDRLSGAVAGFSGLSIAALNGSCAGGALGMILACDLRITVPGASFFYPVIKVGVTPQPADPARLVALAGASTAKRMLLTGAKLSADEALRTGLVDQITDQLDQTLSDTTQAALAAKPGLVARIKTMI